MRPRLSAEDHRRNASSIEQLSETLAEIWLKLGKCSTDSVHTQHIELIMEKPAAQCWFHRLIQLFREEIPQLPETQRLTVWLIWEGMLGGAGHRLYLDSVTGNTYLGKGKRITPAPFFPEDLAFRRSREVLTFVTEVQQQGTAVAASAAANKL